MFFVPINISSAYTSIVAWYMPAIETPLTFAGRLNSAHSVQESPLSIVSVNVISYVLVFSSSDCVFKALSASQLSSLTAVAVIMILSLVTASFPLLKIVIVASDGVPSFNFDVSIDLTYGFSGGGLDSPDPDDVPDAPADSDSACSSSFPRQPDNRHPAKITIRITNMAVAVFVVDLLLAAMVLHTLVCDCIKHV